MISICLVLETEAKIHSSLCKLISRKINQNYELPYYYKTKKKSSKFITTSLDKFPKVDIFTMQIFYVYCGLIHRFFSGV